MNYEQDLLNARLNADNLIGSNAEAEVDVDSGIDEEFFEQMLQLIADENKENTHFNSCATASAGKLNKIMYCVLMMMMAVDWFFYGSAGLHTLLLAGVP